MEKIPTWQLVVAAALQREDGAWLMHRRPDHKHHGGLWEFPGGKVENGENPRVALSRELKEELDIDVRPGDLEALFFAEEPADERECPIVILLYTLRIWTGEPVTVEGGALDWFNPDQTRSLAKPPLDVELAAKLFQKVQG